MLLSVTDHGPGIPEGDRKHAVERFVRLEASRTQPGSGLGLSLASAVATLHGGELRLGDAHPGLVATLAIPALAAASRQACPSNAGCATEGGMNSSAPGNAERQELAARFVGGPHVSASSNAEQILGDWLSELEPAQSAALDALLAHPFAKTILSGIAEFSPYLFDLVRADAARLIRVLKCDPEPHLAALIENTTRDVFAAPGETDVMHLLRRMKAEAALMIALCDIGGVWPVMRVTAALTDLAVASVQAALRFLLRQEVARGRMTAAEPRPARGRQRPDRARDGQDGRGRAELFQRHRPDRVLRSRRPPRSSPTSSRRRSSCG